ncbi:hypothetical protein FGB62_15g010 [Gracilaria domingensis]|nr:hypothetical protein FGB62_15g010 [Gracilaria domingensis]
MTRNSGQGRWRCCYERCVSAACTRVPTDFVCAINCFWVARIARVLGIRLAPQNLPRCEARARANAPRARERRGSDARDDGDAAAGGLGAVRRAAAGRAAAGRAAAGAHARAARGGGANRRGAPAARRVLRAQLRAAGRAAARGVRRGAAAVRAAAAAQAARAQALRRVHDGRLHCARRGELQPAARARREGGVQRDGPGARRAGLPRVPAPLWARLRAVPPHDGRRGGAAGRGVRAGAGYRAGLLCKERAAAGPDDGAADALPGVRVCGRQEHGRRRLGGDPRRGAPRPRLLHVSVLRRRRAAGEAGARRRRLDGRADGAGRLRGGDDRAAGGARERRRVAGGAAPRGGARRARGGAQPVRGGVLSRAGPAQRDRDARALPARRRRARRRRRRRGHRRLCGRRRGPRAARRLQRRRTRRRRVAAFSVMQRR